MRRMWVMLVGEKEGMQDGDSLALCLGLDDCLRLLVALRQGMIGNQ